MGMGDEPWEILKPKRKPTEPKTLTPSEASEKFGPLQGQTKDCLFEVSYYLDFDRPEGCWKPQLDVSKQLICYYLSPQKRAR